MKRKPSHSRHILKLYIKKKSGDLLMVIATHQRLVKLY
jgi:hypothetical protein